jgi:hypothetical protein
MKRKLGFQGLQWRQVREKWDQDGTLVVYKGYCLRSTCYTLSEARKLLGEKDPLKDNSVMQIAPSLPVSPQADLELPGILFPHVVSRQERERRGLCPECRKQPVQLYKIRKSNFFSNN